jgi:hypothetical protein
MNDYAQPDGNWRAGLWRGRDRARPGIVTLFWVAVRLLLSNATGAVSVTHQDGRPGSGFGQYLCFLVGVVGALPGDPSPWCEAITDNIHYRSDDSIDNQSPDNSG